MLKPFKNIIFLYISLLINLNFNFLKYHLFLIIIYSIEINIWIYPVFISNIFLIEYRIMVYKAFCVLSTLDFWLKLKKRINIVNLKNNLPPKNINIFYEYINSF